MIRTKCPHCGKLLGVNEAAAGSMALCPMCKQKFRIPGAKPGGAAEAKAPAAAPAKSSPAAPPLKKSPAANELPVVEIDGERRRGKVEKRAPAAPRWKRARP